MAMGPLLAVEWVPFGSQWKYWDAGSAPSGAWTEVGYNDEAWVSGAAQLGYGDGDEATVISFGGDPNQKHTTTYFRLPFEVSQPESLGALILDVVRDDGVVVYLNGEEVLRDNLPTGGIAYDTFALAAVGGSDESTPVSTSFGADLLLAGTNLLAVEIHQANSTSSDISFDLRLADAPPAGLTRGPYLQRSSASQITIRWRSSAVTDSVVHYGTEPDNLSSSMTLPDMVVDHEVVLGGLVPGTRYYYSVGNSTGVFAQGNDFYFETHPVTGTAAQARIWVLGDSGTADANAQAVRNAFKTFNGDNAHVDLLLMLGDNAYQNGTDSEYQSAVFDMYPETLRNTALWSTLGNHDGYSAQSSSQSGPYYDIHTFPRAGEAGGTPSGTEAYYSFDYGHIHFVCLDSYDSDRSSNGAMATWLQNDLASTTQEWLIAFWHHPPYSKGSHDSDSETALVEMRERFLPILEDYGVDLVLSGHSHSYERSMLINGHYGHSSSFDSSMVVDGGTGDPSGDGAYAKVPADPVGGSVYAVAGSSGKITSASLDHPIMVANLVELGSMVLDVDGAVLDAYFLNEQGVVRDHFRLQHDVAPSDVPAAPTDLAATVLGADAIDLQWTDNATNESRYVVERTTDATIWTVVAVLPADASQVTDAGLLPDETYTYRVFAENAVGSSPSSSHVTATTDSLPPYVDVVAGSEIVTHGTVSGDFNRTHADDEILQVITEVESGGKPSKRHSRLEHTWLFQVPSGLSAVLFANVFAETSSDGDQFRFTYSVDGGSTWVNAFTVSSSDPANVESALLAGAPGTTVRIRVTDTDRSRGNRALDSVSIDELFIRTETVAGDPPSAPTNLVAVAQGPSMIALTWDNQDNELGFEVERQATGEPAAQVVASLGEDTTAYEDIQVLPSMTYTYHVRAYNASGTSERSNAAVASTPVGISLTASARKVKGAVQVTLDWSNALTDEVAIYRDGVFLAKADNTGTFVDNTGLKGGGSLTYQVCHHGDPDACSNEVTVTY